APSARVAADASGTRAAAGAARTGRRSSRRSSVFSSWRLRRRAAWPRFRSPPGSLAQAAVQPRLQHHRGGDLVDHGASRALADVRGGHPLLRDDRRETLVVQLDLDAVARGDLAERVDLTAGRTRRRSVAARQRPGQPHHDRRRACDARGRDDRGVVGGVVAAAREHLVRQRDRAAGIREGETDAATAEVDAEDARHPREATASRARASATSSASSTACGFGPPPTTASALRLVPPPSAFAAGCAISAAETPLDTRSFVTATAIAAFLPSAVSPVSTTTPDP